MKPSKVMLPEQLPAGGRRDSLVSGPRALALAVLEDAIRCLEAPHRGRPRRTAIEAEAWIRDRDARAPFSFENVCAALDLEASRLRAALLARIDARRAPEGAPGYPATVYQLKLRMKLVSGALELSKRVRAAR